MEKTPKTTPPKHILFLDGECLFCQRSARILHRFDRAQRIHFSTLQGETAAMLPDDWKKLTDDLGRPAGTAVLVENAGETNECRWRSADAILRSLRLTGSLLCAAWLFYYLPKLVKDGLYRFIARNRHRLTWGKRACPLPEQGFKNKFLP